MTIAQTLKSATTRLTAAHVFPPYLEAEILLSAVLKKPRGFLIAHNELKLTQAQTAKYQALIHRRLKGEPSAYLTGHKEFYGLNFEVNKNVLIPRPETELMVEQALKHIAQNIQHATIADVGTGSGCIIISLAEAIKNESRIMNYELWGIDISKKALSAAKKNAKLHGVNKYIKFVQGNLLNPIIHYSLFIIHYSQLIILANLPYLTNQQIKSSPAIKHEPRLALAGGKNGLALYEKLFKQIALLPVPCYVLCEVDPGQTNLIKKLVKQRLPQASCQIKKDLAGLNRLAIIKL